MKILSKCESCKNRAVIVKKRRYVMKQIPDGFTSKSNLCRTCYTNVRKMLGLKSPLEKLISCLHIKQ